MSALLIATGNSHKTAEIRSMIGDSFSITDLSSHPDLPEVDETGATFLENATLKATEISKQLPGLVLSDDSGLEVDILDGAPGVISARYAGPHATTAENNAKLIAKLEGIPVEKCTARFRCVMVIARDGEVLGHFDGSSEGHITTEDRGTQGFGYDPHFIPLGHDLTFAELGDDVKNTLSHRAVALQKAAKWLRDQS